MKSLTYLEEYDVSFKVYGSKAVLDFYSRLLGISLESFPGNVFFEDVCSVSDFIPGKVSVEAGKAQFEYLKSAVSAVKSGGIDAIVTLPINKESIKSAGFNFPGHTEYFASEFKIKDFAMMLANSKLKVVLETTHIPLNKVANRISSDSIFKKLLLIDRYFPGEKIAVAGLNPHAGESGLFGDEEERVIKPAIKKARDLGLKVYGPFPSDTVFNRAVSGEFGTVLCMYHDQGLIPVKLTGFEETVNVTLGLPFVRTSVGHGTAYDIAGKGIASVKSFISAVDLAVKMLG
nr:4-hydroxythreonine-4-phosphate dehydrogenase PdxA [Desulfurobacterium atlanticum]